MPCIWKKERVPSRMNAKKTRSHLKSVFLISKMPQKKAEFSQLKMWVHKNTEILRGGFQSLILKRVRFGGNYAAALHESHKNLKFTK